MNLRKIVDNYVECNAFEIKIINGKIKVYYYDKIDGFSQKKITISKDKNKISVEGSDLIIETMFEELLIISGNIEKIILGNNNE